MKVLEVAFVRIVITIKIILRLMFGDILFTLLHLGVDVFLPVLTDEIGVLTARPGGLCLSSGNEDLHNGT